MPPSSSPPPPDPAENPSSSAPDEPSAPEDPSSGSPAPNGAQAPAPDDAPAPPDPSATTLGAVQEPQRLHSLTLLLRLGASLPALFFILLPTFQNPNSGNVLSVVLSIFYGVVALPAIVLQYLRFSYRITPKQIVIQKGVLRRQNRSIPIERIQNIQIQQNLMARIVGIAKVTIETAGSSATEGSLEYVSLSDAHEIRQVVRAFQHRTAKGTSPAEDDASADADPTEEADATADDPPSETLFSMPLSRVLLSGAFRFSLLYIALIFSVVQFVDPELIVQRVLRSQGQIEEITNTMAVHPALTVLGTTLVAVFFGWISGIAIHLTRYYGFSLWLDGDKLRKRHGLFTVTEGTIPLGKVQALILRTNPLMRAFGWYELEVQTVGMNVDEQGHRVIAPFAQYDDILALAQRVRSFDLPETFGSVSRLTIRRRFVRYTLALSALLGPGIYLWPAEWWHLGGAALPWWGFALVPLLLVWAVLQYRNHGYAVRDDGLYIQRGVLTHYLWILPTEKFHAFHAPASVFQRRLNLKTLFVDTAGAAAFAYPEVIDLPAAEADAQMDRLYRRFQTLYRTRIEEATGAPDTRLDAADRPRLPVSGDGDAE